MSRKKDVEKSFRASARVLSRALAETPEPRTRYAAGYNGLMNFYAHSLPSLIDSRLVFEDDSHREIAKITVLHPPSIYLADLMTVAIALQKFPDLDKGIETITVNGVSRSKRVFDQALSEYGRLPKPMTDAEIPAYVRCVEEFYTFGMPKEAESIAMEFADRFLMAHHVMERAGSSPDVEKGPEKGNLLKTVTSFFSSRFGRRNP